MSKKTTKFHLCFNIFHLIMAVFGFVYLAIHEFNTAAFWSFVSGVFFLANTHLHLLHLLDKLENWHNPYTLSSIKCLAFSASILILSMIAWYIFTLLYFIIPLLNPDEDNTEMKVLQAIGWSCASLVGTISLYWAACRYTKILTSEERQPLLS